MKMVGLVAILVGVVAFILFLRFAWSTYETANEEETEVHTPFVCPLNGQECNENCAWYDGEGDTPCRIAKRLVL